MVLLDETDTPGALQVAERMRESIAEMVIQGEFGQVEVTTSIGLATLPNHASEREQLLKAADEALYDAKENGRNRVHVFGKRRCNQPKEAIGVGEGRAQR